MSRSTVVCEELTPQIGFANLVIKPDVAALQKKESTALLFL